MFFSLFVLGFLYPELEVQVCSLDVKDGTDRYQYGSIITSKKTYNNKSPKPKYVEVYNHPNCSFELSNEKKVTYGGVMTFLTQCIQTASDTLKGAGFLIIRGET